MNEEDADSIFKVVPLFDPDALSFLTSSKRLCRDIIGWKHLSHPNILLLLGVSTSTDPYYFRILTKWMPNGNVMRYATSNPEVNRLRLVSSVPVIYVVHHRHLAVRGRFGRGVLGIVHGYLKGVS
jgi:hypothetical protein